MFTPDPKLLKKYADVLVKYALNSGAGVKLGEVVQCVVPDIAKPMLVALHQSILEAGAHPMMRMIPTGINKTFYELANDEQLIFFPKKFVKSRIDTIDHSVGILADHDLKELAGVDVAKIMKAQEASKEAREWMSDKEYAGKFTWTMGLYPTPASAKEANLTLEAYWQEIIKACFLDEADPVAKWQTVSREQNRIMDILNSLPIDRIHVVAANTDLWFKYGIKRRFVGGSGRNIPSFEIFTSPDWRGTNGHIQFTEPLYRYGNLITDIFLRFKNGQVIEAKAKKGQKLLEEMIKRPNADKVGEFSMTDSRMSNITKFMANTLFDENVGGRYGNTHLAVGMSYKDAYAGNPTGIPKKDWKQMGFNDSGEHCDIVATSDRIITFVMTDGSEKVIFADGKFQV